MGYLSLELRYSTDTAQRSGGSRRPPLALEITQSERFEIIRREGQHLSVARFLVVGQGGHGLPLRSGSMVQGDGSCAG